jgi:elongation factor P
MASGELLDRTRETQLRSEQPAEGGTMVSTGEIKRGMTIELDGNLYQIVEFQHIKMGRGSAQVRMKLRNVRRGDLIEKTFQAGDRFARARLDHRDVQYMYHDGDLYHFMDTKTYDQVALDADQLGDAVNYLTDGMVVTLNEYESEPIGVDLPPSVVMTVTSVEFGLKGDTATGANKPATLESGLKVNVPLFVNQGDKIKVDTRTGEYIERAS